LSEIEELEALGVIRPFHGRPLGVSPLQVVSHNGKRRIIFDLRRLNEQLVAAPSFKMPAVADAASWCSRPNARLWTVDIQKMFYHIPTHPKLQPWLCFRHPASGAMWTFAALPMGLQQAPWVATKTLAPCLSLLRRQVDFLQYMDDALGVSSANSAHSDFEMYKATLQAFGWTISPTKCRPPSTNATYLGFVIDVARTPTISLEARKRAAMLRGTRRLIKTRSAPSPRVLAQTVGMLVAAYPAAPAIRHHMRSLHSCLSEAVASSGWRSRAPIRLNDEAIDSLHRLRAGLAAELTTSMPFVPPLPPTARISTDASSEWGWGAVLQTPESTTPFESQGVWRERILLPSGLDLLHKAQQAWYENGKAMPARLEKKYDRSIRAMEIKDPHITAKEAIAVLFGILARLPNLIEHRLLIETDATTVVGAVLKRASPSKVLNHIVLLIYSALDLIDATIAGVTHVPGVLNVRPDLLSRQWLPRNKKLEWPINRAVPPWLWRTSFGTRLPDHLIDAFASSGNAVARRFWSYGPDPTAEAQNGLVQPWSGEDMWINPPFEIMAEVVDKLLQDPPHRAVVISPDWPATSWYRRLSKHASRARLLEPSQVIQYGPTTNLAEPLRNPRWKLVAWTIENPIGRSTRPSSTLKPSSAPPPWRCWKKGEWSAVLQQLQPQRRDEIRSRPPSSC
jgi:hypothetical protein